MQSPTVAVCLCTVGGSWSTWRNQRGEHAKSTDDDTKPTHGLDATPKKDVTSLTKDNVGLVVPSLSSLYSTNMAMALICSSYFLNQNVFETINKYHNEHMKLTVI